MPTIDNIRTTPDGIATKYYVNNDVVANAVPQVDSIKTVAGPPGPQGVGISYVTIANTSLIVTLTDNSSVNAGILPTGPEGPEGPTGPAGPIGPTGEQGIQGIQGLKGDAGQTGLQGLAGAPGPKGDEGQIGQTGLGLPGVSVSNAAISNTSHLILTLTNNSTVDAGLLPTGPQGATGSPGPNGPNGPTGKTGASISGATINSSSRLILTISNAVTSTTSTIDAGLIPTGPSGPSGPPGPAGPPGVGQTGQTGSPGPTGSPGGSGPPGATGGPGPIGLTYETVVSYPAATGGITLDLTSNNFFNIRMTGNITISFSSTPLTTRTYSAVIAIKQRATGSGIVTWPANCNTPGNATFTQSTVADAVDLYTVFTYDGGITFILTQIGQAYS